MKPYSTHPWDPRSYHGGANTDVDPKALALSNSGEYRDASDMRRAGVSAEDAALVRIDGERIRYPASEDGADTYVCIGAVEVLGKAFTIWASNDPAQFPPFIQIDGITVVKSGQLPYLFNLKLQLAVSEDCEGGFVFDARSGTIPLVWDVRDILAAFDSNSDRYFGGFILEQHQVNQAAPVARPLFRGFEQVPSGGGMIPGQVFYAQRYADDNGNVTAIGPELGGIYVPVFTLDNISQGFQNSGLAGAAVNDFGVRTNIGVKLRVRIDNITNSSRMEIVRVQYNLNGGIDAVPEVYVVHQRAISPGELGWFDWTDIGEQITLIEADAVQEQRFFIRSANSVRYINYRLVYGGVVIDPKNIPLTFREENGQKVVPFTKNLGPKGHADPVAHCYDKSFTRGERYGLYCSIRDPASGKTFGQEINPNWQAPNRRDEKTGDPMTFSDHAIYGANVDHVVTPTFDVFDHDEAIGQQEMDRVVNIMQEGRRRIGPGGGYPETVYTDALNLEGGTYQDSFNGISYLKTDGLKPLRPVRPNDSDKFGLRYRVNKFVRNRTGGNLGASVPYNPQVFDVNHHALGALVYGPTDVPAGYAGFEISRTAPAKRVLFQALGQWKLRPGSSPAAKEQFVMRVHIPDFDMGIIGQDVMSALSNNPSTIRAQMVCPLGMCSQVYGAATSQMSPLNPGTAKANIADMISYARVRWDNGQINPGLAIGGYSPGSPLPLGQDHFVGHGSWRNPVNLNDPWHIGGNNGNSLVGVSSFTMVDDNIFEIVFSQAIYNTPGPTNQDFNDPLVAAWQEPWYVINIVQDGAIPDDTLGLYSCNHYQAMRSCIGRYAGGTEDFVLIYERWEDVRAYLPNDLRYAWVIPPDGGAAQAYVCKTNAPFVILNLPTILSDINGLQGYWLAPDGTQVYGICEALQNGNDWSVRIGVNGTFPIPGSRIEIRYNNDAPIRLLGGESVISAALGRLADHEVTAYAQPFFSDPVSFPGQEGAVAFFTQLAFPGETPYHIGGAPVPFSEFMFNPRYMVPFGLGYPGFGSYHFSVDQLGHGELMNARQWVTLFDCESRAPAFLSGFENAAGGTFPNIHYMMRPYNFDPNVSAEGNGVHDGYFDSVYPGEPQANWVRGGFKDAKRVATDYMLQRQALFFTRSEFDPDEKTDLCNAVVYTPKVSPLVRGTTGFRTFPATNIYFIEDNAGPIQRLYASTSLTRGHNLAVFTDHGICLLLIEKSVAYSADGQSFTMFKNDNFIGGEVWRSKLIGMPGDYWQTAGEGSSFPGNTRTEADMICWFDGDTVRQFINDDPQDLGIGKYRVALRAEAADRRGIMDGVFDRTRHEYWVKIHDKVLVYAFTPGLQGWNGKYTYDFDAYLCLKARMLGMRDGGTWELGIGDTINGEEINEWVQNVSGRLPDERQEWLHVFIQGDKNVKPARVEFSDEDDVLQCWLDDPTFGPSYLKFQNGYQNHIPCRNTSIDPERKRLQGWWMFFRIFKPRRVGLTKIQYKPIK